MGESWKSWAACAAVFRDKVKAHTEDAKEQDHLFDEFFSRTVDKEQLVARALSEQEMDRLIGERKSHRDPPQKKGFVSLVGAGPGDPGLLTVRALQRLANCDAVVYDRLAMPAMPGFLADSVELHPVGKQPHHHPVPQEEINELLVRLAGQGKRVVRFKGGDPFVFGRGGEEAMALVHAGVPFEIVPGVTSGIAAPGCAGIPVTHRETSVRLTLVTGHESDKDSGPQVRWDLLAKDENATVVGYMSVGRLPTITETLIAHGMSPDTPAALVQKGCTGAQSTLISTVSELAKDAQEAGISPPAVFVIGPTVSLGSSLRWFSSRPLSGKRIAIFYREQQLAAELDLAGAEVLRIDFPMGHAAKKLIETNPVTHFVFTSEWQIEKMHENGEIGKLGETVEALCMNEHMALLAKDLGWKNMKIFPWDVSLSAN